MRIWPLAIPLRKPFRHAVGEREVADPVVVEVELADGTLGYGETLPRPYVSDETLESVIRCLRGELLNALVELRPAGFPEALECIDALPDRTRAGEVMTAARAGLELALLDAYSRHFERPIAEVVGWLGLPGLGPPGSIRLARYGGVISGDEVGRLAWSVRKMRWFGLRDFKLKVGYEDDVERIRAVARVLGRSLGSKFTLRLDANGAWTPERAVEVLKAVTDVPVSCVEQPLDRDHESDLQALRQQTGAKVMHDESLVTRQDAERLVEAGVADGFNIRLSKNGGFLPALRLAHLARKQGILCQLGCMVGETSILSAAGRRFLENVPNVTFAEGSYGRFLLRGDVAWKPVGFGYGGRPKSLPGPGWGVTVDAGKLREYVRPGVIELAL
ncbi:MAG TPA: enolase C-terminal domain-like protein [Phycisphaerae bacterium]|nr:enolase C-terminal domain-like protein [Phycisphaerae bacterium]